MYGIGYEKSDVKSKRIGSGFKSLTQDSHFPKLQEKFEHNLGKYAYKHPDAINAVDNGLEKMRKVLVTYYKDKYSNIKDQAKREEQICLDAFTNKDDPTSAGQVGKIKYANLCKIIQRNVPEGDKEINSQIDKQTGMAGASNLREKMTAFYNAAYYKGYKDTDPEKNITNFKNIAQKIAVGGKSELVNELDLDSSILEEQKKTSSDPRKAGVVKAIYNSGNVHKMFSFWGDLIRKCQHREKKYKNNEELFEKEKFDKDKQFAKRMHNKDVYDMALISLDQKNSRAVIDNIKSGSNLRYRDEDEQNQMRRSLTYYNDMGLNLSERETEFIIDSVSEEYLKSHKLPEKNKDETDQSFNQRIKDHAVRYAVYMDKIRAKLDPNYTPSENLEKEVYDDISNDPTLNEEVEKTKSPIKEGIVYKDIPQKGGFLKDEMIDKHNVRIVNGISMTTARMLKTFKWLNLESDLLNFRLALMGWMLPTDDHSLWEIIIGSHNVGVKGKEDLTDIVSLNQSVDPLKEPELRNNVCEKIDGESMFPHEIVYLKQRTSASLMQNDEGYRQTFTVGNEEYDCYGDNIGTVASEKNGEMFLSQEEEQSLNESPSKEEIGHSAQKIALMNYTTSAYQAMNEAAAMDGSFFRKVFLKSRLLNNLFGKKYLKLEDEENIYRKLKEIKTTSKIKGKDKNSIPQREKAQELLNQHENISSKEYQQYLADLYTELNMSKNALGSVPQKYNEHVYSGTWMAKNDLFSSYKKGKIIEFYMFTSTSKSLNTAKTFIGGMHGLSKGRKTIHKNALLDIKLNGKNAVDITPEDNENKVLSYYDTGEQEVLCPPGTKIKINEVIDDIDLQKYDGTNSNSKDIKMDKEKYEKEKIAHEEEKHKAEEEGKTEEYIKELDEGFGKRYGTLVKAEEV